ncbi:MAG: hypothetical protein ACR2PL_04590 [Dehalococcoidia bacterium]
MMAQQSEVLVFADYAGNCYTIAREALEQYRNTGRNGSFVIPRDKLAQCRVPDERKAAVVARIEGEEVRGFTAVEQPLYIQVDPGPADSLTLLGIAATAELAEPNVR